MGEENNKARSSRPPNRPTCKHCGTSCFATKPCPEWLRDEAERDRTKQAEDKAYHQGFTDGVDEGKQLRDNSMSTSLERLTFQNKENLVLQMFDVQNGYVSCRRMAKELIECHKRESERRTHD